VDLNCLKTGELT